MVVIFAGTPVPVLPKPPAPRVVWFTFPKEKWICDPVMETI